MPSVDLTQVSPLEVPSLIAMLPAAVSWQLRPTTPALPSNAFLVSSSFHAQNRFGEGSSSRKERRRQPTTAGESCPCRTCRHFHGWMRRCFPVSLPPTFIRNQSSPIRLTLTHIHPQPARHSTTQHKTTQRSSPTAPVRPCPSLSVSSRPCRALDKQPKFQTIRHGSSRILTRCLPPLLIDKLQRAFILTLDPRRSPPSGISSSAAAPLLIRQPRLYPLCHMLSRCSVHVFAHLLPVLPSSAGSWHQPLTS